MRRQASGRKKKPRRGGAPRATKKGLLLLVLAFGRAARGAPRAGRSGAGRCAASRRGWSRAARRRLLAGMLRRSRMLLLRELAVGIFIELGEVLFVRRTCRLLLADGAVLVLIQGLEHLLRAAFGLGCAGGCGTRGAGAGRTGGR